MQCCSAVLYGQYKKEIGTHACMHARTRERDAGAEGSDSFLVNDSVFIAFYGVDYFPLTGLHPWVLGSKPLLLRGGDRESEMEQTEEVNLEFRACFEEQPGDGRYLLSVWDGCLY